MGIGEVFMGLGTRNVPIFWGVYWISVTSLHTMTEYSSNERFQCYCILVEGADLVKIAGTLPIVCIVKVTRSIAGKMKQEHSGRYP